MLKKYSLLLIISFLFSSLSHAGYDCYKANDDGTHGKSLVNIDRLEKDLDVLQSIFHGAFYYDGSTYIKYQYWGDAGNGYNMVYFSGLSDSLVDGAPQQKGLLLFCKNDGFIGEGGL